jgi:hypothetical protein
LATTEDDDVNLMLALETATAVCYARPFTRGRGVGRLSKEWAPEDPTERSLHGQLIVRRHRAHAHTDARSGRDVRDRGELYDDGVAGFVESWLAMDREVLKVVADICGRQEQRFQDAAYERLTQLKGRLANEDGDAPGG